MILRNLPPVIQMLSKLSHTWNDQGWIDYRALGIGPEHIPALIDVVRRSPDFWNDEVDDNTFWTPMHAWRSLAQLQALEALPDLVAALRWIDEEDSDLVQEDLPHVFAEYGLPAASALIDYLTNPGNESWARIAAANALQLIAEKAPEFRLDAVQALSRVLDRFEQEEAHFNGFIIKYLISLKAVEAAPLVGQVYRAKQADVSIAGDWEDFQVSVGLLSVRQTPRTSHPLYEQAFSDGIPREEAVDPTKGPRRAERSAEKKQRATRRKIEKQLKKKRREALHKKNISKKNGKKKKSK